MPSLEQYNTCFGFEFQKNYKKKSDMQDVFTPANPVSKESTNHAAVSCRLSTCLKNRD